MSAYSAKTIILNDNVYPSSDIEQAIYHECGHYEWHSMFFELQKLHSADLKLLEYQEADKASKPAEKDIRWVERQAIYVSYAEIFPRPVLMPMVQEYWREIANSNDNTGKKISYVIYRISQEKQKRRSLIKARLIMLAQRLQKVLAIMSMAATLNRLPLIQSVLVLVKRLLSVVLNLQSCMKKKRTFAA